MSNKFRFETLQQWWNQTMWTSWNCRVSPILYVPHISCSISDFTFHIPQIIFYFSYPTFYILRPRPAPYIPCPVSYIPFSTFRVSYFMSYIWYPTFHDSYFIFYMTYPTFRRIFYGLFPYILHFIFHIPRLIIPIQCSAFYILFSHAHRAVTLLCIN